jgi:hypothetical protein
LVVTPATLVAGAVVAPGGVRVVELGFGGVLAFVGVVAVAVDGRRGFEQVIGFEEGGGFELDDADLGVVLASVGAAGATYALSVHAGLGPVVASAVVGLAAGVGLRDGGSGDVPAAAYCGSFVGMASPAVFSSVAGVFVAGLVAGVGFVVTRESFAGFGGKLGTLALFGCLSTGAVLDVEYVAGAVLGWHSLVVVGPVAAVGAVVTDALRDRAGLGPVVASAVVGLVAGSVLPVVLPDVGGVVATVVFCASFVGMSSSDRLGSAVLVGAAGALCGVVFVAVSPAFVGAGGKLGTTAFLACLGAYAVDGRRGA